MLANQVVQRELLASNIGPAVLPGWRRTADRTRLHANSLLTGNFTGNFANSRLLGPVSGQESTVPQRFFAKFPTQRNREIILDNREIICKNREFLSF
jgi:hypothetical protein